MIFIRRMIILVVWIPLIECLVLPTGVQKDRYVVRENTAFEIDCVHNLEKVSRVKWEYISTHDVSETIYDSQQPNNTFKSGFEVSCQPHETLISKCSLKLVQARKEDSGKYICYVAEEDDADTLQMVTEIEVIVRGPISKIQAVNMGDSVILPCEHNIKNLTRARWSHVSTKGVTTYSLFHLPLKDTLNRNYEALCEPHELSCNLKLLEANKESTGKYICLVGESQEFEEKYALDPMTHFIEIELVVGDLLCNENMNKDLTLIGENDCYGIEADVLNLKCSFNYFGNINYNLPHLRWIEKNKFNSLEKKLNSSSINHEVKDETKKISIQTSLSVAYEMQNSTFQCVLDDTQVKPCQLHEFKIQYIKNTTERSPPIFSNDLHNMKCLAKKSANVQCSYYWFHQIAGAMVETPYPSLPVEHMVFTCSPGIYICIAKCHLRSNKECIIKAMEVEVVQGSNISGLVIGLIVGLILGVAATIFLYILCKKYVRKRFKAWKNKTNNITEPLLGGVGHETEVLLDQDKQQGRKEEDKITKLSPEPTNPLKVLNMLHENNTEYHEIKIYEANDNNYGKVLMIDGAVWDAELDKFSYQRMMTALPIRSHPYPRKVLVIGGGEVRLVNELVENSKVKSITVCEVDGILLAMCRDYVPSLASSFDDDKVKINMEDGFEFLKKTEDTFDVIINHSSNTEGPSKYLFTKEYYELVKSKLNERGVVASIVNGKDEPGSDVLEETTMKFCQQLFPEVHYVCIPAFNHPSNLVRSLVCSLDDETDFKAIFHEMNDEYRAGVVKKRLKEKLDDPLKELTNHLDSLKQNEEMSIEGMQTIEKFEEMITKALEKRKKLVGADDDDEGVLREKLEPSAEEYLKKIVCGETIIDHRNKLKRSRLIGIVKGKNTGHELLHKKKTLYEEATLHHDVVIYKSIKGGMVFLIDGAIWSTEIDPLIPMTLTSTALLSHEEPKDVLVIGGGNGLIAKYLLEHPKVESITVYEVDERIIELGRKYFPSFAHSMDDPKVKVRVGDGNEFMMEQENAFDIIFINSTKLQDNCFDKEYYEAIQKALKNGGIVSLAVTGKEIKNADDGGNDSDDDNDDVLAIKEMVEQIFPSVTYFCFPFYEHPGTLIRCLLCGLKDGIKFSGLFELIIKEKMKQQSKDEESLIEWLIQSMSGNKDKDI